MELLILDHKRVVSSLAMSKCIELMAEALESLARGEVHLPLRMIVSPPSTTAVMALMPAYQSGNRAGFGVKAICVFPGNHAVGKDTHQGGILLFSAETGELLAVVNASAVTAIRTAAVSAVATRILARESAHDLAIIGAGIQGRTHLAAIAEVRSIKRARVADVIFERARKFATEMSANYHFPIEAVPEVEAAVRHADIIVTVTNSSEPVLQRDWISDGAHLNVIGASARNAREVDTATMAASKVYVDRRESALNESGDYLMAANEGAIGPNHIQAEIGEVLIGTATGRTCDREITLFKALGLAVEDLAAAEYLYRQAKEKRFGSWVEF
jgi:ornithine cyclodeaminase/alanine dehydrogenase-like protein (mu-crystallin family)